MFIEQAEKLTSHGQSIGVTVVSISPSVALAQYHTRRFTLKIAKRALLVKASTWRRVLWTSGLSK